MIRPKALAATLPYILFCFLVFAPAGRADQGFAISGYAGDLYPFNYKEHGKYKGIAVDILELLAKRTGHPLDEITAIAWARAVEDVQSGAPGMVVFSLVRTEERESHYAWVGPIGTLRLGLVAHKGRGITVHTPHDLNSYHIGVIRNSAPVSLLKEVLGPDTTAIKPLLSNEIQFRMLEAGRVDLITQSSSAAPRIMRSMGMEPADYEMVYVLRNLDLYLAFSPKTPPEAIEAFQKELDAIRKPATDGACEYDEIVSHHLGGGGPIELSHGHETPGLQ